MSTTDPAKNVEYIKQSHAKKKDALGAVEYNKIKFVTEPPGGADCRLPAYASSGYSQPGPSGSGRTPLRANDCHGQNHGNRAQPVRARSAPGQHQPAVGSAFAGPAAASAASVASVASAAAAIFSA